MKKLKIAISLAHEGYDNLGLSPPQLLELIEDHDALLVEVNWGSEGADDIWIRMYFLDQAHYNTLFRALKPLDPIEINNPGHTGDGLMAFNMNANFLQVSDILVKAGHTFIVN